MNVVAFPLGLNYVATTLCCKRMSVQNAVSYDLFLNLKFKWWKRFQWWSFFCSLLMIVVFLKFHMYLKESWNKFLVANDTYRIDLAYFDRCFKSKSDRRQHSTLIEWIHFILLRTDLIDIINLLFYFTIRWWYASLNNSTFLLPLIIRYLFASLSDVILMSNYESFKALGL